MGKRSRRSKTPAPTAGDKWYDLPRGGGEQFKFDSNTVENDIRALALRPLLFKGRHYKSGAKIGGKKGMPEFFHVATVEEGAGEFYSSRLRKRERASTFVDELLRDSEFTKRSKQKFKELQQSRKGPKKWWAKKRRKKAQSKGNLYHPFA